MRILLILLFIFSFLLVAIPTFSGMIAQQQLDGIQDTLIAQQQIHLISRQHQRGWLSSYMENHIELPQGLGNIDLQHQINHGFVPVKAVNIDTLIGFNEQLQQRLAFYLGEIDKAEIQTQFIPLQPIKAKFTVSRAKLKETAISGELTLRPDSAQVDGSFFLHQLQIPQLVRAISFFRTHIQIQTDSPTPQSFTVHSQSQTQQTQLDLWHQDDLALDNSALKLQAALHEALLNLSIDLLVPQLQVGGHFFEPLKLVLHLQNIDWQIVQQLLILLQKPPIQQRFMLPLFLLQNAPSFISRQPSVRLEQLHLHGAQGSLQATLDVQVEAIPKNQPIHSAALLQAVQWQLDVRLKKTLAEQIFAIYLLETQGDLSPTQAMQMSRERLATQVRRWQQQGWLREENGHYVSQLQWRNGALHRCTECR